MNEYKQVFNAFEAAIIAAGRASNANQSSESIRHALKIALAHIIGRQELEHRPLEEALKAARLDEQKRRVAAIIILRSLVISGAIPRSSEHCIVDIFESALTDLFKSLQYDPKKQTYEKWAILTSVHQRIESDCGRIFSAKKSLQEVESAKKLILKGMGGTLIQEYCRPLGLESIRTEIQTLLGLITDILDAQDSKLGSAIAVARTHVAEFDARHRSETNFLSSRYVVPFLSMIAVALESYDRESLARSEVEIVLRMSTSELAVKRYPLMEAGRTIVVTVPFENLGPGTAQRLVAKLSVDTNFAAANDAIHFGDVLPGAFSLSFPVLIVEPTQELDVLMDLSWATRASPERPNLHASVQLTAQDSGIDWAALAKTDCYSTEVAEGREFVGRKEKVTAVINRLVATRMQSTYITGQKRIGKTSLAYAVRDALESDPNYESYSVLYLEWGDYARMDARETVVALGTEIASFLAGQLSSPVPIDRAEFSGTLAPLIRMAKALFSSAPHKRYVIVLDEFDEIHPDMYRYGPLAEALFSNLRTLSSQRNIALILVGGERMPFVIGAQGDQLNKFVREGLDYFSRNEEWVDYQRLVEEPTRHRLRWQPSAVNRIFELTNGHPYYTKLVCSKILRNAVADRDSDITRIEADKAAHAVVAALDTNVFAHYWKDGIQGDKEVEEAVSLKRQRALGGLARALRAADSPTLENIASHARTFGLEAHEVQPVLQEFCRREILEETRGVYTCRVALFAHWLCEVGASRLVVDTFGDQIADSLRRAEEEAYVSAYELVSLVGGWDTYRGQRLGADDVRAWLGQVSTNREQRLLFRILQAVRFVSEAEIRQMLRSAYGMLTNHIKPHVKHKRSDRRRDILIVYVDGEGKSGQYYASKFAEENEISSACVMNADDFSRKAAAYETKASVLVDAVVVVDDIIGTGASLSENLVRFASENAEFMQHRNCMLAVVALMAVPRGEQRVRKAISEFPFGADLRVCEIIGSRHYAFSEEGGLWGDRGDLDQAKAMCVEIGSRVYKRQPLGFGEQGLLVVFPVTCPNNSLPILHSESRSADRWTPLFPRPSN